MIPCAQKESFHTLSLHTNPLFSRVCSLLYSPSARKKKPQWHIIQLYNVFKEKPTVIHNCTNNLKHYLVHSQLIPPTHKLSTMNKLPTVCQLCRCCSIYPPCKNITVLQLTKYWCCQFINDLCFALHSCWWMIMIKLLCFIWGHLSVSFIFLGKIIINQASADDYFHFWLIC